MHVETTELQQRTLERTINFLLGLKEDEFYYGTYVKKWDSLDQCGTTCCVAGWYPKWYPACDLYWNTFGELCSRQANLQTDHIRQTLCEFHNLPLPVIEALFYGYPLYNEKNELILSYVGYAGNHLIGLVGVINRFRLVLNALKEGLYIASQIEEP